MKNFGKLALLGAALAVSATSAFATPYTGGINAADTPVPNSAVVFSAGNVTIAPFNGTDTFNPATSQPTGAGVAANLGYYVGADLSGNSKDDTLGNINTATISGEVLFTGFAIAGSYSGAPDEVEFIGSGLLTAVTDVGGVVNFTAYGNFVDQGPNSYTSTYGIDQVVYNPTNGNLTEDFTVVAPEPNSLMLLGTGLVSGAGMLMRRRRLTA